MQIQFEELKEVKQQGVENTALLQQVLTAHLPELEKEFVQDLSHISDAARYTGDMQIDNIVYLKDNLYRCDYSYQWDIAWTCSGTQESGRAKEKVRFTLEPSGLLMFKFLKLEL